MANDKPAAPRATSNRSTVPVSNGFQDYISSQWAERPAATVVAREEAALAAARRASIGAKHPGTRIIIPAGTAAVRSNDTDYPFRAHSAFAHLTGWGSDSVPGSILLLTPTADGHEATLYFRKAAGRDSDEFYANPEVGEFWTGPRPSLSEVAALLDIETADLAGFASVLDALDGATVIVREADRDLTDQVDGRRLLAADVDQVETAGDADLARDLSELRLVKDSWEIEQMRLAVAATKKGFDDVIADLPQVMAHTRGERLVEGTFNRRARAEGNTVGYDTIAASGPHACVLHWTRNDGPVTPGDLMLLDAGIELDSYYTADITRTLPVNGTYSPVQRRVYEAVLSTAS